MFLLLVLEDMETNSNKGKKEFENWRNLNMGYEINRQRNTPVLAKLTQKVSTHPITTSGKHDSKLKRPFTLIITVSYSPISGQAYNLINGGTQTTRVRRIPIPIHLTSTLKQLLLQYQRAQQQLTVTGEK